MTDLPSQSTIAVAPHAGAWIETISSAKSVKKRLVAPHAGAWIETDRLAVAVHDCESRAPRGRVD